MVERGTLHYISLDLLELKRTTPRHWCSATTVEQHLAKHAAFHDYITAHHTNQTRLRGGS